MLVATMLFGGGGFNPATASPVDPQESGVVQPLAEAEGLVEEPNEVLSAKPEPLTAESITPEISTEQPSDPLMSETSDATLPADKREAENHLENKESANPAKKLELDVSESTIQQNLTGEDPASGPVLMRVPAADSKTGIINVKIRAVRAGSLGDNGVPQNPAEGSVKLQLQQATNNVTDRPGAAIYAENAPSTHWASCTVDADGDCSFSIASPNLDKRYWVTPLSASPAYYFNETLITGNNTDSGNSGWAQTPYTFRTTVVKAGTRQDLPSSATNLANAGMPTSSQVTIRNDGIANRDTSVRWRSSGFYPVSIANNRFVPTCKPGLSVGVVFDLSQSMNGAGLPGAKTATKELFKALSNSGSNPLVSVYPFSSNAPASTNNSGNNFSAEATSGNRASFDSRVDGLRTVLATNWDRGLWQVAKQSRKHDIVVVLTDGNPTRFSKDALGTINNQYWTAFQEIEHSIFSANALKATGAQVLALGVGSGITYLDKGDNVAAVSGPKRWDGVSRLVDADYALTDDWAEVAKQLAALAKGATCQSEITVKKQIRGLDDKLSNGVNWSITGKKTAGSGTLDPSGTVATDQDGTARFDMKFTEPTGSGTVNIAEAQQAGHAFESAVCKVNGVNRPVTQAEAFDLTLAVGDQAECTIVNKMLPPVPVIKKSSDPVSGTEVKPGETINYTLSFGNEGHSPLAVDYVDHLANVLDDATFNNDIRITGTGLTAVLGGTNNDQILIKGTVAPNQTVTIKYSVKVKTEKFGDGIAKNFVVPKGDNPPTVCEPGSELCTEHPIPGKLVTAKSSDPESGSYVEPGSTVKYTLTFKNTGASAVDVKHMDNLRDVLDDATFNASSLVSGSGLNTKLVGNELQITGEVPAEKTITVTYTVTIKEKDFGNGTAANFLIPNGEEPPKVCEPDDPDCTTHPVFGTATWVKTDASSKALAGSEWELTRPGDTEPVAIKDCIADNVSACTGLDHDPEAGKFKLESLKWGEYSLKETKAPAGYVLSSKVYKFTLGNTEGAKIVINLPDIVNDQQPALSLPLTGGLGSQSFFIGGGAILLAALAVLGIRRRKGASQ